MENPIIEKLRKLIAHESSARSIGNQAEAEAFAEKIQELLTRHKLEMSEVQFDQREVEEPIDFEPVFNVGSHNISEYNYWRVALANTIAESRAFKQWMKNYRNSWKVGYATALSERLKKQYAAMTAPHTAAMVHIKKDAVAVQDFMNKNGATPGRCASTHVKNSDGFHAGEHTGQAVNLSPIRFGKTSGRTRRLLGS